MIASVSSDVPTGLTEITRLGRTLKRGAADVLARFDRPGTSNRPTEALNGRLGHLRGSADLASAEAHLRAELEAWATDGKPIVVTECGADTLADLHFVTGEPWTEGSRPPTSP